MKTKLVFGVGTLALIALWIGLFFFGAKVEQPATDSEIYILEKENFKEKSWKDYYSNQCVNITMSNVILSGKLIESEVNNLTLQWRLFVITNRLPNL